MATRKKTKVKAKKTKKKKKTATRPAARKRAVRKSAGKKTAAKKRLKATSKKAKAKKAKKAQAKKTRPKKAASKKSKAKKSKAGAKKAPARRAAAPPKPAPAPAAPSPAPAWSPRAFPEPAGTAAEEREIGTVTHYFTHLSVAIVRLESGSLREGDVVRIKGHTSDFTQPVESMEIDHMPVSEAHPGQSVGMRVNEHAREHDVVYKVEG